MGMLQDIGRRLAGRSPTEIARLAAKNIGYGVARLAPAAVAARRRDAAFDRRWGTETSALVNLSTLSVDRARARHGVRYQPSGTDALDRAVAALAIDPAGWSLVDYGSGKGRVVLAAAHYGFARAVGVEFAPELFAAAQENARRFVAAGGAARPPEFVLGDAGAYAPPPGPLLAYLYNPFGPAVLDEVIARLEAKAAAGDAVAVAYLDPRHLDRFAPERWTVERNEDDLALLTAR